MRGTSNGNAGRRGFAGLVIASVLAAGGCSGLDGGSSETRAGLGCVDDSKACIEQRQAALQGMLADKSRGWVKEPATPQAYASGVRMFAYKARKRELSCDELSAGRREADNAPGVLRAASAQGLSPAQISRGSMFAAEVGKELSAEQKRRCKV